MFISYEYIYACMYVRIRVHVYVCMYTYLHVCMYECMYVFHYWHYRFMEMLSKKNSAEIEYLMGEIKVGVHKDVVREIGIMHVCMYECMYGYVYMYACMYVCMYVCMCLFIDIYMYVRNYVIMYVCIYLFTDPR